MRRSMLLGAIVALLVAALLGGAFLYSRSRSAEDAMLPTEPVVLVFASPATDGATVASVVTLVADGRVTDISPDTTVSVSGTADQSLRDSYVFGGGRQIAAAVLATSSTTPRYIVVPESVWAKSMEATGGLRATLPNDITAFDGSRLTMLSSGEQTLTPVQVAAVLRSLPFMSAAQRSAVRKQLSLGLIRSLSSGSVDSSALETNVPRSMLDSWITQQLKTAVVSEPL